MAVAGRVEQSTQALDTSYRASVFRSRLFGPLATIIAVASAERMFCQGTRRVPLQCTKQSATAIADRDTALVRLPDAGFFLHCCRYCCNQPDLRFNVRPEWEAALSQRNKSPSGWLHPAQCK